MPTKAKLHFYRFEFKYILPKKLRDDLERELGFFMELDPYVASQAGSKYKVRSLYYDDPSFTSFYEKTDGIRTRSKFRVRTYTTDANEECATFLEVKGRHNALVFKHRTPLDLGLKGRFKRGEILTPDNVLKRIPDGLVKEQFAYESLRKRLMPMMLIDYARRPLVSKYDPEFRLTFDDSLTGTPTNCLYPASLDTPRKILPGYTVMEVKFRYHMPKWFHRLVQSYELRRVSISKVCSGVEVCELTEVFD